MSSAPFTWRDGRRTVVFGPDALEAAAGLLDGPYVVVTTPRGRRAAERVVAGAAAVHELEPGRVDELAGALLSEIADGALVVGLGGGRVIDTAKALAAARRGRAAAIPTTLSGAEMTGIHRPAAGAPQGTGFARPAIVLNDPALCASQPAPALAASAGNALGHALEGPLAPGRNPVATLAAEEAARLLTGAWEDPTAPDRPALALGALLAGYVIDATGYGLHHVLSQTLVRFGGAGHGPANTALLPHTTAALRARAPERVAALDAALAEDVEDAAARLADLAGARRLRDLGVEQDALAGCAERAAERPELDAIPPRPDAEEIARIYAEAW